MHIEIVLNLLSSTPFVASTTPLMAIPFHFPLLRLSLVHNPHQSISASSEEMTKGLHDQLKTYNIIATVPGAVRKPKGFLPFSNLSPDASGYLEKLLPGLPVAPTFDPELR
jgi:hypothetical protein